MTEAKADLINLGLDSPQRWYDELVSGEIPLLRARPGLSKEWYEAYTIWCKREGMRSAPCPRFVHALERKRGVKTKRAFYSVGQTRPGPHGFLLMGETAADDGRTQETILGDHVAAFRHDLSEYRGHT